MVDSFGHKSDNGMWDGMVAMASSVEADIGIGNYVKTKERSEVVAFTNTVGFTR